MSNRERLQRNILQRGCFYSKAESFVNITAYVRVIKFDTNTKTQDMGGGAQHTSGSSGAGE